MHPEEHGNPQIQQVLGHRLIGGQHEFLDDPMGQVAFLLDDLGGLALHVEDHFGLGKIEIDAAAIHPAPPQNLAQLLHGLEIRGQSCVPLGQRRRRTAKQGVHIRVGHALIAADHAFIDLIAEPHPRGIKQHLHRQRQPVLPRVEAADPVGEPFREHRNDPVRKVDAVGPLAGLQIERLIPSHVMGDVGNMDPETELLGVGPTAQGG